MSARLIAERLEDRVTPTFVAGPLFTSGPANPTPPATVSVSVAADFNGDGRADVALAIQVFGGPATSELRILIGNGDGTFAAGQTLPLVSNAPPQALLAADVNGDGLADLIVTTNDATGEVGTTAVYLGAGNGTFSSTFASNFAATGVVVGEFTGDGNVDLAVLEPGTSTFSPPAPAQPGVRVYAGDGAGNFAAPGTLTPFAFSARRLLAADFDADGKLDVATFDSGGNLAVLPGVGNGTFAAPISIPLPARGADLGVGDFTGDGRPDLVTFTQDQNLTVFRNTTAAPGTPTFAAGLPVFLSSFSTAARLAVADFDLDGLADVVARDTILQNGSLVFTGSAAGTLQPDAGNPYPFQPGVTATDVNAADFDGDGDADFVVLGNGTAPTGRVYFNLATSPTTTTVAVAPRYVGQGQPVTLTATVTPQLPTGAPPVTPTGTVQFTLNGTPVGTAALATNGTATLTIAAPVPGDYTVIATYIPDSTAPFTGSTSAPAPLTVVPPPIAGAPATASFGSPVTLTGAPQPPTINSASPTGSVTFVIDGVAVGTAPLVNGVATLTLSNLAVGSRNFFVTYTGDTTYPPGQSATRVILITPAATATTVTVPTAPVPFGDPVPLSATVAPSTLAGTAATGSVTFVVDGVAVGTVPLVNGAASFSATGLAAGPHSVIASYSGDGNFAASASAIATANVSPAATATTVAVPANPVAFGQPVPLSVTVAPSTLSGVAATGSVTFFIDGVAVGSAALVNGAASLSVNGVGVGPHTVTASYSGDGNFAASASGIATANVSPAATATTVIVPANPVPFGQPVPLSVTVAPSTLSGVAATGGVTFFIDGVAVGSAALVNGAASLSVNGVGVGPHTVTASYSGDANFLPSTSAAATATVSRAATATTVAVPTAPVAFGQPVPLSATVSPASLSGVAATGSVTFFIDGVAVGTAALVNGIANFAATGVGVGPHTVTASYSGDANFLPSTSAAARLSVTPLPTTTTVSVTPSPAAFGDTVSLRAAVAPASPGGPSPVGTVTFFVDGTAVGSLALPANGVAVLALPGLVPSRYAITATFTPATTAPYTASASQPVSLTVGRAPTTTSVSASPTPGLNQDVILTASVSPAALVGRPVTGTLTFFDGQTPLGSAPVGAGGSASIIAANLPVGTRSITAAYSGDDFFTPSLSAPLSLPSGRRGVTAALIAAPAIVTVGSPVTLIATLTPTRLGPVPTGNVTFSDGGIILGIVAVDVDGVAILETTALPTGDRLVTAAYSGDDTYLPASADAAVRVEALVVPPPPPLPPVPLFAVGTDNGPVGCIYRADGTLDHGVANFGPDFGRGVRLTAGDLTGDGIADLVAASSPGGPSRIVIQDGATGATIAEFAPFEDSFTGGVTTALGDIDGDGRLDLAVAADLGGSPRVRVYLNTPNGFVLVTDFYGIADPNFRGGARIALGDVDGDGLADLAVAAGAGGGPRIAFYAGSSLRPGLVPTPMMGDFFAFEQALRDGATIALADVNGDGRADLIAGAGSGGAPRVSVFDGVALMANRPVPFASFYSGDPDSRAGVRVAGRDLDGDGFAEILTGAGPGAGNTVRAFGGQAVTAGVSRPLFEVEPFPGLTAGVYVG